MFVLIWTITSDLLGYASQNSVKDKIGLKIYKFYLPIIKIIKMKFEMTVIENLYEISNIKIEDKKINPVYTDGDSSLHPSSQLHTYL